MSYDTRSRYSDNPPNTIHSAPGSGEVVQLFEGAWHASPIPEDAIDGTKLVLQDFYNATEVIGGAKTAAGHAFNGVFSALHFLAPTPWAQPEAYAYPYWSAVHKKEIMLGTQAVADLIQKHLEAPKRRLLTPGAARVAHFVVYDFPLGDVRGEQSL